MSAAVLLVPLRAFMRRTGTPVPFSPFVDQCIQRRLHTATHNVNPAKVAHLPVHWTFRKWGFFCSSIFE
jgi:hypothetical protein